MAYLLTNQNNFPHIPYPSPGNPNATVKSGGCGPAAALMIVENMTKERFYMADWVRWTLLTGARRTGGTDMRILAPAVASRFRLSYTVSDSEAALVSHLKAGGMAIANVGGAYGDWRGLFSTAGHYVTVFTADKDGRLIVGDPDYREGKYSAGTLGKWRSQFVTVKDRLVYVKKENLHRDTLHRAPNYHLFAVPVKGGESEEDMQRYEKERDIPDWGKATVAKLLRQGYLKGTGGGNLNLSEDMLRIMVVHDRAGLYDR